MSFGEAEREYFGVYDAFAAGDRERATRRCPRIVSNQNPSPTHKERVAASAVAAIGTQRAARSRWSTSSSVDGSGDERRLDLHHRAATVPHSSPPSRSPLSLSPAPLKHAPWRAWPSGPRRQPRQRPSWRSWPVKKLGEEWERKDDDGEQNLRKKKNSLSLPSLSLASLALQNKDNQLTGLDFVLRASPAASPAPLSFLAWTCCGKEGRKNEEKKKRGRKT